MLLVWKGGVHAPQVSAQLYYIGAFKLMPNCTTLKLIPNSAYCQCSIELGIHVMDLLPNCSTFGIHAVPLPNFVSEM